MLTMPAFGTNSSISVTGIPSTEILDIWPEVEDLLKEALAYNPGHNTLQEIKATLIRADAQLWIAIDETDMLYGCAVTQLNKYPTGKLACTIWLVAGQEMKAWLHCITYIERWAISKGCSHLEGWGRKGWKKVMSRYEFNDIASFYSKQLGSMH